MNSTERNALLSSWIQPSSQNEEQQQERAQRMVEEAIAAKSVLDTVSKKIYAKGSYPNNTNVRNDSDVDIVVECQHPFFSEKASGITLTNTSSYEGVWTRSYWRECIIYALVDKFGASSVDTTGKIAIEIAAVTGSRPSIDVVPSFLYKRSITYDTAIEGTCVWTTDSKKVVNWPNQQLVNGRQKNTDSGGRYKRFVRALKNAENVLAANGAIAELPSYFMECLVWNVDNGILQYGDLEQGFKLTLAEIYGAVTNETRRSTLQEPNKIKPLFGNQKWAPEDAEKLVLEIWGYLDYA